MEQHPNIPAFSEQRPRLAIAGASGFIGTAVCRALCKDYDILALTRSRARAQRADPDVPVTWRFCDMFSRKEVEAALVGAEYAIYLAHSRLPSSRLTQARPEDMDLLMADNFARAAQRNNIKQIIYVGGLIPEGKVSKQLLASRNEIEETLISHGTPITALRASLVAGPGGSAMRLLINLATRLPIVLLPQWSLTRKQPIASVDLVKAIRYCLANPETFNQYFDIGGPDAMNFAEILRETAAALGKTPVIVTLPWVPRRLYAWWLRLLDRSAHPDLVRLFVNSLRHDMTARENALQNSLIKEALPYHQALTTYTAKAHKTSYRNPRSAFRHHDNTDLQEESRVRSIQRIKLPPNRNAAWVADTYFRWLPRFVWPWVLCQLDAEGSCQIYTRFPRLHLLTLTFKPTHSSPDRRMYFITGGILAKPPVNRRARFEFRDVLNDRFTIAAIHDYAPFLPWYFYSASQALIHLSVMKAYQRHLAKLANR